MHEQVQQPWWSNQCLARVVGQEDHFAVTTGPQAFSESDVGAWAFVAGTGAQSYLRVEAEIGADCRGLLIGDKQSRMEWTYNSSYNMPEK
jgi:hypothetical protein